MFIERLHVLKGLLGSSAVYGKRNLFYARLGYVKVPRSEEAFDSRILLLSTAFDPTFVLDNRVHYEIHLVSHKIS